MQSQTALPLWPSLWGRTSLVSRGGDAACFRDVPQSKPDLKWSGEIREWWDCIGEAFASGSIRPPDPEVYLRDQPTASHNEVVNGVWEIGEEDGMDWEQSRQVNDSGQRGVDSTEVDDIDNDSKRKCLKEMTLEDWEALGIPPTLHLSDVAGRGLLDGQVSNARPTTPPSDSAGEGASPGWMDEYVDWQGGH